MDDNHMQDVLAKIGTLQEHARNRLKANKCVILDAVRKCGGRRLLVAYSGGGDSGCIENVEMYGAESIEPIDVSAVSISVTMKSSSFERGGWVDQPKERVVSLTDAATEFAYDWLEANHLGWEINEGSDGEIEFDLDADTVTFTHHSHYTVSAKCPS